MLALIVPGLLVRRVVGYSRHYEIKLHQLRRHPFFQLYVVQFCCRLLRLSRGGVAAPGDTGFSFLFASEPKIMGKVLGIVYRTIDTHLTRYLERQGLLERDAEYSYLALDRSDEDPMDQLRGHSITYRIAVGPQQGRKVFTLQTLAALVPKPRVNLTRFHGVFAPNSKHRAVVTPAKRGKGNKARTADEWQDQTPTERRAAMTWAHPKVGPSRGRLKCVFGIDIKTCRECGGTVKVMPNALAALAGQAVSGEFLFMRQWVYEKVRCSVVSMNSC